MGITYGDNLVDSGYRELTPEQERRIDEHEASKTAGETKIERDRQVCQCPRCGRTHWHLGNPPGLKARGIGRIADNEKAVVLYFDRPLTDNELRELHDETRIIEIGPMEGWGKVYNDGFLAGKEESAAEIRRLRAALNTEPVLTDEQREQLTRGYGAILPATEVFELGWRTALGHVRRTLEQKGAGDENTV